MTEYKGKHVNRYAHEDGCSDPRHGFGRSMCVVHRMVDMRGDVVGKHADPEKRIPWNWSK